LPQKDCLLLPARFFNLIYRNVDKPQSKSFVTIQVIFKKAKRLRAKLLKSFGQDDQTAKQFKAFCHYIILPFFCA
jgi:hypothetical protein